MAQLFPFPFKNFTGHVLFIRRYFYFILFCFLRASLKQVKLGILGKGLLMLAEKQCKHFGKHWSKNRNELLVLLITDDKPTDWHCLLRDKAVKGSSYCVLIIA